jgi:hypothetical protein
MTEESRKSAGATEVAMLLQALDEAFQKKTWHGPNLMGSLRGVSASEALWRPAPGRHSIWELAVHTAYWKYTALYRIGLAERGSFYLKGSNFFPVPDSPIENEWREVARRMKHYHKAVTDALAALDDSRLDQRQPGRQTTLRQIFLGLAFHDVYHAGQIQLLKRLRKTPEAL